MWPRDYRHLAESHPTGSINKHSKSYHVITSSEALTVMERWNPEDKDQPFYIPSHKCGWLWSPLFTMKCHCSCHIFKSSTQPAFCLFRRYKRWLACGRPRSCCVAGSHCAGCSVSQYDHSTWHPQHSSLYLAPFYSLYNQGEVYTFKTSKWCVCVFYFFLCFLFFLLSARGQPGADPHFCSRTHSSQTDHSLRSEILQKFPWGNVRIHSFSRWALSLTDINTWFLFKAFV